MHQNKCYLWLMHSFILLGVAGMLSACVNAAQVQGVIGGPANIPARSAEEKPYPALNHAAEKETAARKPLSPEEQSRLKKSLAH